MTISQIDIQKIIQQIEERSLGADNALFDAMDAVRRDLSKLKGDVPRLPHEDSLRAWGLLDGILDQPVKPDKSSEKVEEEILPVIMSVITPIEEHQGVDNMDNKIDMLSKEDEKKLRSRLQHILGKTAALGSEDGKVRVEVSQWLSGNKQFPIPHIDFLEKRGVWPSEPQIATHELAKVDEMLVANRANDILPFLETLDARFYAGRFPEEEAAARKLVENARNTVEMKLARIEIEQAKINLTAHQYDAALRELNALKVRFKSAGALGEITVALDDVDRARKEELAARTKQAELLEESDDLPAREAAWKAVKELDAENLVAEKAILEIGKKKDLSELVRELDELTPELEDALAKQDLQKLNALRGKFEKSVLLLQGTDYAKTAAFAQESFTKQYKELRERLGIGATREVQGALGLAYQEYRNMLNEGIPYVEVYKHISVDGKKSLAENITLMPASEAFEYIAVEYVDFLKTKILESIDRLKEYENEPKEILPRIAAIRKDFIEDANLSKDHSLLLSREVSELKRIEVEAGEAIEKYDQASALYLQAQESHDMPLTEKYKLLLQANMLFPNLRGLQDAIRKNEEAQVSLKGNQVKTALSTARQLATAQKYDEARQVLASQRIQAEEVGGDIFSEYLACGEQITLKEQTEKEQERKDQAAAAREAEQKREEAEREAVRRREEAAREAAKKQEEEERQAREEANTQRDLEQRKAKIKEMLDEYDQSQSNFHLLKLVEEVILDTEALYPGKRMETISLRRELMNRQGSSQLLESGENAYTAQKWVEAAEAFLKVKDPKAVELVSLRLRRAQAASLAEEAEAAFKTKDYFNAMRRAQMARDAFFGDGSSASGLGLDDATRSIANLLPGLLDAIEDTQRRERAELDHQDQLRREAEVLEQKLAKRKADEEFAAQQNREKATRVLNEANHFLVQVTRAQTSRMVSELVNGDFAFQKLLDKVKTERDSNAEYRIPLHEAGDAIRTAWRGFNRAMMRVAVETDVIAMAALVLASKKADEVRDAGLFEREDEALFSSLQAKKLEKEYSNWFVVDEKNLPLQITWQDVENNRRERLRIEKYRPVLVEGAKRKDILKILQAQIAGFLEVTSENEIETPEEYPNKDIVDQLRTWESQIFNLPEDTPSKNILECLDEWVHQVSGMVAYQDILQLFGEQMHQIFAMPDANQSKETIKLLEKRLRNISDQRILTDIEKNIKDTVGLVKADDEAGLQQAYSSVLDAMLNLPEVLNSELLLEEGIQLAWKATRWLDASRMAQRFGYFSELNIKFKRQVFEILTNVASAYSENKPEDGQSFLPKELRPKTKDEHVAKKHGEATRNDGNTQPIDLISGDVLSADNIEQIKRIERQLCANAIHRHLTTARAYFDKDTEGDYIQASRFYTLAYRYDPANESVLNGLKLVWERIGGAADELCNEANTLTIHGNTLPDLLKACEQADALLPDINGFIGIANTIVMSPEIKKKLSNASKDLTDKARRWRSFHDQLEDYDRQLKGALSQPVVTGLDAKDINNSRFGWDVIRLRPQILKLQSIMGDMSGRDSEATRAFFDARRMERDALETRLSYLNMAVRKFRIALDAENFEYILENARTLETLWNTETRLDVRLAGVETLIGYQYSDVYVDTPVRHVGIADSQKKNWQEWQTWSQDVIKHYQAIVMLEKTVNIGTDSLLRSTEPIRQAEILKRLDEIKTQLSLTEIVIFCQQLDNLCGLLLGTLDAHPEQNPTSHRAENEIEQIQPAVDKMKTRIETLRILLVYLSGSAKIEKEKLTQPLDDLKKYMQTVRFNWNNAKAPKTQLKTKASAMLKECRNIDPLDLEVIKLKREIESLTV